MEQLTRRERQCVSLAGEGLSNKQIAIRLSRPDRLLTAKTVGHHLASAYAKLGVNNRFDAAERFAQFDPIEPMPSADIHIPRPPSIADALRSTSEGGEGGWLFQAYVRLGKWRSPPRLGGTRAPIILFWALLGLMLIGVGLGGVSVLTSADRIASAIFSKG